LMRSVPPTASALSATLPSTRPLTSWRASEFAIAVACVGLGLSVLLAVRWGCQFGAGSIGSVLMRDSCLCFPGLMLVAQAWSYACGTGN
jgi:hypothetical protein